MIEPVLPAGVSTYSGFCSEKCWRCNDKPGRGDLFLCCRCAVELLNPPPPEPAKQRRRDWLSRLRW